MPSTRTQKHAKSPQVQPAPGLPPTTALLPPREPSLLLPACLAAGLSLLAFLPVLGHDFVEWDDFYNAVNDMIPVRLSNEILASDEEIVAVIAHEMHEIEGLRALFEANDLRMTAAELHRLITPGYKGNLHYQAWDIADKLVLAMRKAHP